MALVQVHLFRPWSASHFMAGLPKTANKIAVLDRTKEQGSLGEPLHLDVATTLARDAVGERRSVGGCCLSCKSSSSSQQ